MSPHDKAILEFHMKRGWVMINEVDDDDVRSVLLKCKDFSEKRKNKDAVNAIMPLIRMQWDPDNKIGECDMEKFFPDMSGVSIQCDSKNTKLKVGIEKGSDGTEMSITAVCRFSVDIKSGTEFDELEEFISDNYLDVCCFVSGGGLIPKLMEIP